MTLTRAHRTLIAIVLAGAVLIAAIGFVGSYAAVRDLAEEKGFGSFAPFFPIGIDAGIVVLLALDLLLTWLRIPFPLLRQTAWLLTAATVAFNGAAAWGDPLAVGMHGIIPVLFIITVEAARHAIGRITDIAADRHIEGVRLWRWILAPIPTFRLWRRMKLWELRSYQEVIDLERDRLVYRTKLRATYGRRWRRRAPVEARLPLKLAHLGVPLDPQHTTRATPTAALQRTDTQPAPAAAAAPAVTARRSGRSGGLAQTAPDGDWRGTADAGSDAEQASTNDSAPSPPPVPKPRPAQPQVAVRIQQDTDAGPDGPIPHPTGTDTEPVQEADSARNAHGGPPVAAEEPKPAPAVAPESGPVPEQTTDTEPPGEQETPRERTPEEKLLQVVDLLEHEPGITSRGLAQRLELPDRTARRLARIAGVIPDIAAALRSDPEISTDQVATHFGVTTGDAGRALRAARQMDTASRPELRVVAG